MQNSQRSIENESQKMIQCLSDEELETLLKNAGSDMMTLLILLMADAGLRLAETLGLKWSDLWYADCPVGMIEVRAEIAKNKKPRQVPVTIRLNDAIAKEFKHYRHLAPDVSLKPIFKVLGDTSHCAKRTVQRRLSLLGQKFLHRRLTPHMLRHTFATRVMRKCSIRVVQQLLGHSSLQSTQIYTHPNNKDLQEAIDALNS
jgi:integrase/recombinase XerD